MMIFFIYRKHHFQCGGMPKMIECDQYALRVSVLLSNGNLRCFESTNCQKYALTTYKLVKGNELSRVKLINSHPLLNCGQTIFFSDEYCFNTPPAIHSSTEGDKSWYCNTISLKNSYPNVRISSACYSIDGSLVIYGCEDGSLFIFNAQDM